MNSTTLAISSAEKLYSEVVSHYKSCIENADYLSDTWEQTLKQKGGLFSVETMARMLELGNPVNTWIDDFNYRIDATILDVSDTITNKLLAHGEPAFGHPRRDCTFLGAYYSSNFIHHVLYASKIIGYIQDRGIVTPRILEIGGGLGGVAYLLKAYFGSRATYFVVDLPEGVMIQEWYLRSCFPDVPTTHKSSRDQACTFIEGGFNFINAYVLESQDFQFDVAINIDSMQEMNSTAVIAYIKFIQRNISSTGLFYFQNHYGQASESITEPSEYPLDEFWLVKHAAISPQIECCSGSEQARIVYYRTAAPENELTRRLVLRLVWNGFVSGQINNYDPLLDRVFAFPAELTPAESLEPILVELASSGVLIPRADIVALLDSPYLPENSYLDTPLKAPKTKNDGCVTSMESLWRAQLGYLNALKAAGEGCQFERLLSGAADALVATQHVSDSAFYSGYYASILFSLGYCDEAEKLLLACTSKSENSLWSVRFAELFTRFGRVHLARDIVKHIEWTHNIDWFVALKAAELSRNIGLLEKLRRTISSDSEKLLCFAKTATQIGELEYAFSACTKLAREHPGTAASSILDVLSFDVDGALTAKIRRLFHGDTKFLDGISSISLAMGFLLLRLGNNDEAMSHIELQINNSWNNYFRLGQLGRYCQNMGLTDLSDKCLDRSMALRPGAFMHLDFIGNVYFNGKRFDRAAAAFSGAVRFKPYLRHLLAKQYYSALSEVVRGSGAFGKPEDLRLIYQRDQDFYHKIGPATK